MSLALEDEQEGRPKEYRMYAYLAVTAVIVSLAIICIRTRRRALVDLAKIANAARGGPLLVRNRNNGNVALVRIDDFARELKADMEALDRKERNPWEHAIFYVQPTFTFSDWPKNFMGMAGGEADRTAQKLFMQTGILRDCNNLILKLAESETGLRRADLVRNACTFLGSRLGYERALNEFDKLQDRLVRNHDCIFVPFSSGRMPLDEQKALYGYYALPDAEEYLIRAGETPKQDERAWARIFSAQREQKQAAP